MPKEPSFENAIAFAADLIRIPGLSGREGDVAQRVLEEMQALGFSDVRMDVVGNVIGVTPGLGEAPPVLLNCHLDVVDDWQHDDGGFLAGLKCDPAGALQIIHRPA